MHETYPLFLKSFYIFETENHQTDNISKSVLILTFCRAPCQYWFAENNKLWVLILCHGGTNYLSPICIWHICLLFKNDLFAFSVFMKDETNCFKKIHVSPCHCGRRWCSPAWGESSPPDKWCSGLSQRQHDARGFQELQCRNLRCKSDSDSIVRFVSEFSYS